ncbi:alpha-1,2-mannosidase, putative [Pustulibacterium marinum]|uniref:Alpha-1,2-mannosidase, putative n=1 Tax=Pustulibacterium marinum TaxID=1224947 RepID=A0A1I7IAG7_9FLAO|nr:GH92 family glycosyl hydrolase [Pustulibacterium marinum]SFU69955.1 alpha-1,2-mannosidase, putative [Pustulibacterium marinum]
MIVQTCIRQYSKRVTFLVCIAIFISACKQTKQEQKTNKDISKSSSSFTEKVYPLLDTKNSRWFYFSSASRPFGMVNLSPDTRIEGAWGSGYRFESDTVKGFSHIHAWQLSGVSVMPVVMKETDEQHIFQDFYSKFNHQNEEITPGYHHLKLERYQIDVALTSSTRVGFHKYTFPKEKEKGILFNLNTILGPCTNAEGFLKKVNDSTLEGSLIAQPTYRRPKATKIFFYVSLNSEIESIQKDEVTGNYLVKLDNQLNEVKMKLAISYTSNENAKENLVNEIPEWNFNEIVNASKKEWNSELSKIEITGGTDQTQRRFYTDLWHALQGRRIISDVNGAYPDYTGTSFRIGQLPLDKEGKPMFNHYNSDSFWGAQWTINTLWGLVYPERMKEFSLSLMQYYKDGGLIPRGPSGGNYTYVMTGASSTPFMVSAIQKGIVKENLDSIYLALKKNHMPGGIMERAGYEHNTQKGGGFSYYMKNGYVPYPLPDGEFGGHQDGVSLTLEYAYQDWTLAQLADKMGYKEDATYFLKRAQNYKNVFDSAIGWMHPKDVSGNWSVKYDPYTYQNGFIEANGAQATWFVPQDILGLANQMGGAEKAIEKLQEQFKTAAKLGFTSGDSHAAELHPEYSRIPINYGNQPSIQTALIFEKLGRPDLTQYWSREVVNTVFSGLNENTGYNGDEDQGLMGSLAVLMKIGLFQMNGGTEADPEYQIGSPIFDKITIHLNPDFYEGETFVITTKNNSDENRYLKKILWNDKELHKTSLKHSSITSGGILELEMSNQ